jgi:hypothetical protein
MGNEWEMGPVWIRGVYTLNAWRGDSMSSDDRIAENLGRVVSVPSREAKPRPGGDLRRMGDVARVARSGVNPDRVRLESGKNHPQPIQA